MTTLLFPPVDEADEDGFLGIGGPVSVANLLSAYTNGIFPWPWSDQYVAWFAPPLRAILPTESLHISTSLKKFVKKTDFELRIDTSFHNVIEQCALSKNRKHQSGTWITKDIIGGYIALHEHGYAHSFEVYDGEILVGGIYGVGIGGYFSAESMFYLKPNASKFALVKATEFLSKNGITWIDCQVANTTTTQLGAIEIERSDFGILLNSALNNRSPDWPQRST